jgi:DNA-directed RNA polymerase specialized sigma24 family protein
MPNEFDITQEAFDALLDWLAPEREQAGQKYNAIHRRLIEIFTCRGCHDAEALAQETINRVIRRVPEIAATYVGDPALYFYGVALKVYLESLRPKPHVPQPPPPPDPDKLEREDNCLERCMRQLLQPDKRELLLEYHRAGEGPNIEHRREMADRLDIDANALRIRICRIKKKLRECVDACLDEAGAGVK